MKTAFLYSKEVKFPKFQFSLYSNIGDFGEQISGNINLRIVAN